MWLVSPKICIIINMKIKLSLKKMMFYYTIIYFVILIILFLTLLRIFISPWTWIQPTIIGAYTLIISIFYIVIYQNNYYEITRKYVKFKRFSKEFIYFFSEILYVDQEQSQKKNIICFYTIKGHSKYLIGDNKKILLSTIISESKNLISKEEFDRRFPNIKL